MTRHRDSRHGDANSGTQAAHVHGAIIRAGSVDPRSLGLLKAAYSIREAAYALSIGRTSLYAAVGRGDLKPVKFGRKTLFCAADLAAFLIRLRHR